MDFALPLVSNKSTYFAESQSIMQLASRPRQFSTWLTVHIQTHLLLQGLLLYQGKKWL